MSGSSAERVPVVTASALRPRRPQGIAPLMVGFSRGRNGKGRATLASGPAVWKVNRRRLHFSLGEFSAWLAPRARPRSGAPITVWAVDLGAGPALDATRKSPAP